MARKANVVRVVVKVKVVRAAVAGWLRGHSQAIERGCSMCSLPCLRELVKDLRQGEASVRKAECHRHSRRAVSAAAPSAT